LQQPPPDPCDVQPTLPKAAGAAIIRAMAKTPHERHASAGAFVRALQAATSKTETNTTDVLAVT
jgi:hypothetical protein